MTFLQIINLIKETALAQPNVNTFVRNFLDLNREDTVYSSVVLQDRDGLRDRISEQDWNTYTFHLGYVDRLTFDESNRDDIFSTGINIINNIVASIRSTWFPDVEVNIIDRFQTFDQRFTASCAGVYVVLAIQVPISECVDGEQTDLYDKYEATFTENGHYHFVPSGRPIDEIDITIDVDSAKPEERLVEIISSNGSYHYDPSAGSVFSSADITVNCPVPKTEEILVEEITSNGSYHYDPSAGSVFSSADITVDVHPSVSLSETYTENGIYNISGEFNGGDITIEVPVPQFITETLSVSINGTYVPGEGVDGYSQVTVEVQTTGYTEKDITENTINIVNLNNDASYVASYAFIYNNTIETVNLSECTSIGDYAFNTCTSLSQINLPKCVSIGTYAFSGCFSLEQVNLPKCVLIENSVFRGCTSLSQMSLPECEVVGTYAFQGCTSLEKVDLPICTTISNYAFSGCTILNSLTLCNLVYWTIPYQSRMLSNTSIINGTGSIYVRSDTYNNWITSTGWSSLADRFVSINYSIPALSFSDGLVYGETQKLNYDFKTFLEINTNDITGLSLTSCINVINDIFSGCTSLSQISLPECIYIGTNAFSGCTSLSQVSLPKCVLIENSVFRSCTSLSQISLPECEVVGNYAFQCCTSLSQVSLPKCKTINNYAFSGCTSLSQISLPECEIVGTYVFSSCTSLEQVNLPECTYVSSYAFYGCASLSQVSLPKCKTIGPQAFRYCRSFTYVSLPECTYIGGGAFEGTNDASYYLPVCSYIDADAFYTYSFVTITLGYSNIVELGNYPFESYRKNVSIYVPASLVDGYKSAEIWSVYSSQIFPIE